eukprot:scaffold31516_cov37-Attheya_sp.AAC.2
MMLLVRTFAQLHVPVWWLTVRPHRLRPARCGTVESGRIVVVGNTRGKYQRKVYKIGASSLQRKNDVFSTIIMSPMDKRRLVKFMQLALDYATTESAHIENDRTAAAAEIGASGREEDVRSLNERLLISIL